MSSLTDVLGAKVSNLGELIGLLTPLGGINQDWFSNPEIVNIPRRVPELLQLFEDLLGPASDAAGLPGGSWYSIPSPLDGVTPTGFYLVAPAPAAGITSAQIGLGAMDQTGYENFSLTSYGLVPVFQLSAAAAPLLVIDTEASSIGLAASMADGSNFIAPNGVTFKTLKLAVDLPLSSTQSPSMQLVFGEVNGAPAVLPCPDGVCTFGSLEALLNNIGSVGDWIDSVILQGDYWLSKYVGNSSFTVGDILSAACILEIGADGSYQINTSYLQNNVTHPQMIASNFLFNLLDMLADVATPIIPLGSDGGGIYVVKEATDAAGVNDYGVRLMIQDLKLGSGSAANGQSAAQSGDAPPTPPAEVTVQFGKWIMSEQDSESWIARSLGETTEFPQPGVVIYLIQGSPAADAGCSSTGPTVSFAPHVEFISMGLDVRGGGGQPLFDFNGYTLGGAELRVYVKQSGTSVTFGAAVSLDSFGLPLGPSFGTAVQSSTTNTVAQSLLESGSPNPAAGAAIGGDKSSVNPAFSLSAAYVQTGTFDFQLYDADGNPSDKIVFPIQRTFGPLHCQSLGVGWVQSSEMLSLLFNGGIDLDALSVDLFGLSIGVPIAHPGDFSQYDLNLDGLGLTLQSGEVEVSAALVKLGPDPQVNPPRNYTEYDGEALIKAGTFAINAIGSYAYVEQGGSGFTSLFIFGALDGKLGGPAFFFVTGVAVGFGYNRALVLPDQNSVTTFPLVVAASDPSTMGGLPPDPAKALVGLGSAVLPQRGEYWLAAGVRFTSFDLINSTALLVVEFGDELEIALMGLSWISLPPPAAPGAEPAVKYAYAELGIEVKLLPSSGLFSATAVLTSNSFVLDPACKLTGGFAFYTWFGPSEHAGEFVFTLGGYHPDFTPPSYYPQVPRLGFNWPMSGDVTISGEAYFALTPSAVMAGAGLQILFSSGDLHAWFKAQMDALVEWAPFHYVVDISVSIGASYRLHLLFTTVTVSVELGAELTVWGPPTGGKVHVSWSVISFTVSFGADQSDKPPPLDWSNSDGTGFAQTLLPHKTASPSPPPAANLRTRLMAHPSAIEPLAQTSSEATTAPHAIETPGPTSVALDGVYSIVINDGLLSTIQKDSNNIWIVRANHFTFSAVTAVPATEVDVDGPTATTKHTATGACGADYIVYIRPMNETLTSSVFDITMTDEHGNTYDLPGDFDYLLSCRAVPAAKWGAPLANQGPEMNAMLPGRLLGLENITPKPSVLTPAGALALDIDITQSFTYDVLDDPDDPQLPDPYHLPLSVNQAPAGTAPSVEPNAFDEIRQTLADSDVSAARAELLAALQSYGFDPVTNSPMTTLAADPGAVLVGNPLILAAA